MTTLLHIDASARPRRSDEDRFGSHTRRMTARFVSRWKKARPEDRIVYRDVGQAPPRPVTGRWIHAAFTAPEQREHWMREALAESDALVDELIGASLIVAGVPMYNFGPPAQFKAYIDNIVRVGRTFGFDRSRPGAPYWPLLNAKRLVVLSSRGDYGYDEGERIHHSNHVERSVRTAFNYIGVEAFDSVAAEYDEFADERLQASLARADADVDGLVDRLLAETALREDRAAGPGARAEVGARQLGAQAFIDRQDTPSFLVVKDGRWIRLKVWERGEQFSLLMPAMGFVTVALHLWNIEPDDTCIIRSVPE